MNNGAAASGGVLIAYNRQLHMMSVIYNEDTP